jgi:hypothetical protein
MCQHCGHTMHGWNRCGAVRQIDMGATGAPEVLVLRCQCVPVTVEGT